jgi:hypothetical protein
MLELKSRRMTGQAVKHTLFAMIVVDTYLLQPVRPHGKVGNDAEGFYHELGELIDNNFDGCGCWWSQVQRKYKEVVGSEPSCMGRRGTERYHGTLNTHKRKRGTRVKVKLPATHYGLQGTAGCAGRGQCIFVYRCHDSAKVVTLNRGCVT